MLLDSNPLELFQKMDELTKPLHTLSETGIDHRSVLHWESEQILDEKGKDGWRKFSFYEYLWLKLIKELRDFGTPLPVIKEFKKILFASQLDAFVAGMGTADKKKLNEIIRKAGFNKFIDQKGGLEEVLKSPHINRSLASKFHLMVLEILYSNCNCLLMFTKDQQFGAAILNGISTVEKLNAIHELLVKKSTLVVNLSNFVKDFFENDELSGETLYHVAVISKEEKEIIDLLREGGIEEIKIDLKDGGKITYEIKRNKPSKKVFDELQKMMAQHTYGKLEVIMHNGEVVKLNRTDKKRTR